MDYLKKRLREGSTWLGIVTAVLALLGLNVDDETARSLAGGFAALAGIVLMALKEADDVDSSRTDSGNGSESDNARTGEEGGP